LIDDVQTASVWLDLESENPTVTVIFYGDLVVTGEHKGTFLYDAKLIIDLSTGEYAYSEETMISGRVHKTG
jgi:hypothetical protein